MSPAGMIVSLAGLEPVRRYDGLPWTQAQIRESGEPNGPWTLIDTLTLNPVDADPASPQPRDLTTTQAALASGWYQVTFLDAAGHGWQAAPLEFPPAVAEPRILLVTLDELKDELGTTKSSDDARLLRIIRGVTTVIERLTGKRFTPNPGRVSDPPAQITVAVDGPLPPRSFMFGPASFGTPLGPQRTLAEFPITIPHASEIAALQLDTTGVLATGQYQLERDSTLEDPYTRRVVILDPAMLPAQTLTVTGRFGISPPPDDLVDAAMTMAARRAKERDASWGDSVQLPDGGLITYYRSLPPAVRMAIDSYCEITA